MIGNQHCHYSISIVVINLNGKHYLESCLSSLRNQDYPQELIEIILVDNGSQDDSVSFVEHHFPLVKIIRNSSNMGFAHAVNQGAHAATGRYLALINNDARADTLWLKEMVATMQQHQERGVACVGARILDWDGQRIDFALSGMSLHGFGHQFFHHLPVHHVHLEETDILFACGGAMLVDRDVFLQVGGFDDDYFAYFEDIDFGWRLWLFGYRVCLSPRACVYHWHHGSSRYIPEHQINALFERNGLMTIIKNYDEHNLHRILGASLLLLFQRLITYADKKTEIDWQDFELCFPEIPPEHSENTRSQTPTHPASQQIPVSQMTLSYLAGLRNMMQQLPHLLEKRHQIQSRRKRRDLDIFPLFRYPMGHYRCCDMVSNEVIAKFFGFDDMFEDVPLHRILIISTDPIYEQLAGPGIRAVAMARYLAPYCSVVLASPRQSELTIPDVDCVIFDHTDTRAVESLVNQAEVIIIQGFTLYQCPYIEHANKIVVVDLYDPFHLENLEYFRDDDLEHARTLISNNVQMINQQLQVGDFFLCASERQRDFWLGALGSMGRLSPENYAYDPTFCNLIAVVPFGLEPEPPIHRKKVLKGVVPGIEENDTVVLWGGGIWDWLDPLTVIHAMEKVRQQRTDIKFFFMGLHHPNRVDVPKMNMYDQAVALVQERGLEQTVFFNDHWVPYNERANYYLEADIGVSTHLNHIETRFAFRTRILDYIWAGLPMIVSTGDTLADMVKTHHLGLCVNIGDVEGFAQAIFSMANESNLRQSYAPAFAAVQQTYAWTETLKPLIAFCQHPHCAPDRRTTQSVGRQWQRIAELDDIIARKNQHIAHLEHLLKRIESGRVIRLMNTLNGGIIRVVANIVRGLSYAARKKNKRT